MPQKMLRRREVEARTCLSKTTLYRLISAGRFPRPVPLGRRATGLAGRRGGQLVGSAPCRARCSRRRTAAANRWQDCQVALQTMGGLEQPGVKEPKRRDRARAEALDMDDDAVSKAKAPRPKSRRAAVVTTTGRRACVESRLVDRAPEELHPHPVYLEVRGPIRGSEGRQPPSYSATLAEACRHHPGRSDSGRLYALAACRSGRAAVSGLHRV